MRDDSTNNQGSAAASGQPLAHIAEAVPMEMSAPIEEMPSDNPSLEPAAQLAPTPSVLPAHPAPLAENVAPFTTNQAVAPQVEYVQLAPTTLKPQPPPPLKPPVPPRPLPPPAPLTIVAPDPPPEPVIPRVRPVVAVPVRESTVPPVGRSPVVPLPNVSPPALQPFAPPSSQASQTSEPSLFAPSISSTASPVRAETIYSHNTKAVWHFQSSTRRIYVLLGLGLAAALAALFMYWLAIGSPTRVENIPLVRRFINK